MMAHVSVELLAEDVVQAMTEDGGFFEDMIRKLAKAHHRGLARDMLSDLAGSVSPETVRNLHWTFKDMSEVVVQGYNMANLDQLDSNCNSLDEGDTP